MRFAISLMVCALALSVATIGAAQPSTPSQDEMGRVTKVDEAARVIVLDNGRMYRIAPNTVVLVDNQPAAWGTIRPGQTVVIRSGEAVTLRDGQYVVVNPSGTAVTTAPGTTVTTGPSAVVAAPAPAVAPLGVRQTIYGRVTDVDRDGEVKIKTDHGSFEMKMASSEALRQIKKGDQVQLDVTIVPAGTPAASPATR